ncbi:MAG: hypothetical protein QOG64_726 [Acidimicrobiaceae bacterium]|nr:hypothetical protein [Acidimicrobiaceae bacterium]
MIPLKDDNPTSSPAVVTMLLIAACIVVYFFVQPVGQNTIFRRSQSQDVAQQDNNFTFSHAAVPCEVTHGHPLVVNEQHEPVCASGSPEQEPFPNKNVYLAILYSMFLHGSLLHIGGNMLYLWIFGNNIEDRMGKPLYLGFYLLAGVVATGAHILVQPSSVVPVIGASGAIAGVMGAYLVLYPNAPINSLILIPPIVLFRRISAKWLLGFWIISQFFLSPGSGVAWVAHVGGFIFGALVGLVWRSRSKPINRYAY